MSTLKTNNVQVGQSVTATNNFTIYQPSSPDGTVRIGVGNSGATTADVITANSSGNVGIGTSSPASRLHIQGATDCVLTNTAISGSSWFAGSNTSAYILHNTSNTPMLFTTNGTERARIDSSGTLFIGATSSPIGTQRLVLTANGGAGTEPMLFNELRATAATENYVRFYRNGSQVGSITNTLSATAYVTSSDYRLKENVQPMTGALAKITQLKPCTYTWKLDGSDGQGFIAHELAEVVPDAVSGEKDAVNEDNSIKPQGIDTSFLVATLTAAIQEQQVMIEELKAKVTALEGAKG